jgi:plasmid stabilization system protein ParE
MPASGGRGLPRLVVREQDTLERLVDQAHRLLRRDPAAARAVVRALVAEGRRFADTAEGRRWQARLASSDLVHRGRMAWHAWGFDELLDGQEEPGLLPSDWLALVADALARTDLEAMLGKRLREGARDGATPVDHPA